jgi:hypothetical protein
MRIDENIYKDLRVDRQRSAMCKIITIIIRTVQAKKDEGPLGGGKNRCLFHLYLFSRGLFLCNYFFKINCLD